MEMCAGRIATLTRRMSNAFVKLYKCPNRDPLAAGHMQIDQHPSAALKTITVQINYNFTLPIVAASDLPS